MASKHPMPSLKERDIFFAALDLATDPERSTYLDQACGQDASLRASVEALLKNHKEDDPLKEKYDTNWPPLVAGERIGDTIDRYKLLEELGEGGHGVVYLAEQQKPFRRQVALKLIKLGMDTRQVVRRFESERQALAILDHSGIAKVYDAGATANGRPYFVMELVRGIKITEYADILQLTIPQRVELFIKVCKALQHAHERGIVHRDIKPSNILVAEEDGEPLPKVIDFGIAKATDSDGATGKTLITAAGQLIGTPQYMSPEQAGLNGGNVDRRTDIYSLGVLLHELSIGRLPLKIDGIGIHEQIILIREVKPQKPSNTFEHLPASEQAHIVERRKTDVVTLIKAMQGTLDSIVLKCIARDREERFETIGELLGQIQLYIKNYSEEKLEVVKPEITAVRGSINTQSKSVNDRIEAQKSIFTRNYNLLWVPPFVISFETSFLIAISTNAILSTIFTKIYNPVVFLGLLASIVGLSQFAFFKKIRKRIRYSLVGIFPFLAGVNLIPPAIPAYGKSKYAVTRSRKRYYVFACIQTIRIVACLLLISLIILFEFIYVFALFDNKSADLETDFGIIIMLMACVLTRTIVANGKLLKK